MLDFDPTPSEMTKSQLRRAGFGVEAAGFGESAIIYTIRGKPVVALSWMDEGLAGFSVARRYRRRGVATRFITELLIRRGCALPIIDPNPKMLAVLKKITRVSEPSGAGIVSLFYQ